MAVAASLLTFRAYIVDLHAGAPESTYDGLPRSMHFIAATMSHIIRGTLQMLDADITALSYVDDTVNSGTFYVPGSHPTPSLFWGLSSWSVFGRSFFVLDGGARFA